tara:strand:- start:74 stop:340 length:267 start_codon:yes stop_codon:yes gene_type:complete
VPNTKIVGNVQLNKSAMRVRYTATDVLLARSTLLQISALIAGKVPKDSNLKTEPPLAKNVDLEIFKMKKEQLTVSLVFQVNSKIVLEL